MLRFKNHLLVGFIPWIFFGIFYSNDKEMIIISSLGALILMVLLNFIELKKGFILPWGSVILFSLLAINGLWQFVELTPIETSRLINSALAVIVIFSLIICKPFTLQYARESVDSKHWNNSNFIRINWILTAIWAFLMIIMALPSYFLTYDQIHASWFWNYGLMIVCIMIGIRCNKTLPPLLSKR